jgi:hypothetical protein
MGASSLKGKDERVGRYTIQGEIATGGMATVHYGRLVGPAGFTRGVAIKRLHPQFAKNPDFVAMFLDEARLASRILHPNVVPILDVVAEGAELFLVMEFVPGESLSKLVKSAPGGLPITIALSLAIGMLEGLHAAHKALGEDGKPLMIVHRDVSPQNVIVGVDGIARLIDFGVAKATGNATMTRDGQVKGKVAYMAPEQLRSEPVDCRADIYAASVVLWEMLTGKRFFGSADSEAALMLRVLNEAITPASAERKEVPPELDAVILKGLSRDAKDRFGSAQEMVQALEKVAQPAAARDVARWVELKAGEAVALRAQALADFDASVATELPGQASPEVLERSRITTPTLAAPELGPSSSAQPEKQRTGLFVAIAIVVAGGIGFYASRLVSSPEPAPIASVPTGTAEPRESGAPNPQPSTQPIAQPGTQPSALTSAPTASAAPTASVSAAKPHTTPGPRPSTSTVKPARPSCNPPYVITADGLKQYKPECLR